EKDPNDLQLKIVPNKSMERVFKLRLIIHQSPFDLKQLRKQICHYGTSPGRSAPKCEIAYIFKFNSLNAHESATGLKFLGECLGRHVGKANILLGKEWNAIDFVDPLLREVQFKNMTVDVRSLPRDVANHIISITRTHGVDEMYLSIIFAGYLLDPVEMLIELSTIVRTLDIHHAYNQHFLGVANVEWGPIVLKMLNNKLDKFHISSNSGEFISKQSADLLIEEVPKLGKKIDLFIPCNGYYEKDLDYTIHDHWVSASSAPRCGSLRILHTSIRERQERERRTV
ncbi:hypothetical protein PMAYCL1PPCAC_31800, partial [Pristionchus mayeri]